MSGPGGKYAGILDGVVAQGKAVEHLLEQHGSLEEVYGVTTWQPRSDQPPVPAVFGAEKRGLLGRYRYELRVYGELPVRLFDAPYQGVSWSAVCGDVDPESLKLHRHVPGRWRTQEEPPPESIAPYLTLALDTADCFNPDTHYVRLHNGRPEVAGRALHRRLANRLGGLVHL